MERLLTFFPLAAVVIASTVYAQAPTVRFSPRGPAITNVGSCAPTAVDYPEESRKLRQDGAVKFRFYVDERGQLERSEVLKSSGYLLLDTVAREKLSKCTFRPAIGEDGSPQKGNFEVTYIWRLE